MARVFLLALCAAVVRAQDFSSVPALAALPAAPDAAANPNAFFVNDVNHAPVAAPAAGNGFGLGLPESRAAVEDYAAPQLVAPHPEELPQPIPQNAVASALTEVRAGDVPQPVAAAAMAAPPTEAREATDNAPHPIAVAAMAAPTEAREATDNAPHPIAAAAMAAPPATEAREAVDTGAHPIAAAAMAAPVEAREATDNEPHPIAAAAMAAPADAAATTTKATNFKSDAASSSGSGAQIATFAAVGAACVVAIAGVAIARKRKNLKKTGAKTPGTPKNELTFFHVQSRLTPPAV